MRLGQLIRSQRERKFGTKRAAYDEAGVNAATWDKAEAGEPVRGDLLRRIVRTLWPETDGDWTLIADHPSAAAAALEERVHVLEERLARIMRELGPEGRGGSGSDSEMHREKGDNPGITA